MIILLFESEITLSNALQVFQENKVADKLDKRIKIPKNIFNWLEEWVIYLEFQMVKWSLERNHNPQLALFSGVESKFITTYRLQKAHTENSIHTLT